MQNSVESCRGPGHPRRRPSVSADVRNPRAKTRSAHRPRGTSNVRSNRGDSVQPRGVLDEASAHRTNTPGHRFPTSETQGTRAYPPGAAPPGGLTAPDTRAFFDWPSPGGRQGPRHPGVSRLFPSGRTHGIPTPAPAPHEGWARNAARATGRKRAQKRWGGATPPQPGDHPTPDRDGDHTGREGVTPPHHTQRKMPAVTYSPTPSRVQYHRRRQA